MRFILTYRNEDGTNHLCHGQMGYATGCSARDSIVRKMSHRVAKRELRKLLKTVKAANIARGFMGIYGPRISYTKWK